MDTRPRRRFRIGPGLLAAIVAGGCILWRDRDRLLQPGPRPVAVLPTTDDVGLIPEPVWLLHRADAIGLSSEQRRRVEAIVAAWRADTAPVRRAVATAGAAVSGYLNVREPGGSVAPAELQEVSAEYSALSATLATARQAAWNQAWELLRPDQRQRVRELRRADPRALR